MTASIAPTAPPEVRSGLEGVVAFATRRLIRPTAVYVGEPARPIPAQSG